MTPETLSPAPPAHAILMKDLMESFPGAQRALFRKYHLGGCSSCAIDPSESLEALCQRNNISDPQEVLDWIAESEQQDRAMQVTAAELDAMRKKEKPHRLLDIRTREEFDAVQIEGAIFFTKELMNEILGRWPRDLAIVICDHQGKRSLDAAAYFLGQGLQNVRALRGGIDAWSTEVDASLPRYEIEKA